MSHPVLSPAVFFDRDGTLIRDTGYLSDPDDVELVPNAMTALRLVNAARWLAIVATNQSGIARGLFTEADYARVRDRLSQLAKAAGARIDAQYHCPHHPDFSGMCECRKPGAGMFEQAIKEHGIDASRSVFIGDRWRDVSPALYFGAQGILVPGPATPPDEIEQARRDAEIAPTLGDAVRLALE